MVNNLKYFSRKISVHLRKPFTSIATGLSVGFVAGILINVFLLKQNASSYMLLVAGAILGVFMEVFVKFIFDAIQDKQLINPLFRVLGNIATEDSWIYVSGWRRDLQDLEHSKLYRNDSGRSTQPMIMGSEFVYGKGDAIALSYIYQTIEKATRGKTQVTVEDSEQMLNYWGRNVICIGAHNAKTREILGKFKNPFFRFEMNYSIIVESNGAIMNNKDGKRFIDGVNGTMGLDSSYIDYAIIVKLRDEYHPDKNILIIAGLGDNGTAGAAYYLLNKYKELPFEKEEFGVLVEIPSGYESARIVDFNKVSKSFDLSVPEGGNNS